MTPRWWWESNSRRLSPGDTAGRIDGWGHRTVGLGLRQKLDRSVDEPYVLPHVRAAVLDALRRAQLTLDDLDGIEVHNCFTPSEYRAIDHIGLTGPGESWKAIENGEIEPGGRLPVNPSGGLIGGGHRRGEDDGYLITLTTDMNTDASFCVVLDAARIEDGPVCKLQLPERISSGTHSTWAPGEQLRRWGTAESAASAIGL